MHGHSEIDVPLPPHGVYQPNEDGRFAGIGERLNIVRNPLCMSL
jgi:hypothetical protein